MNPFLKIVAFLFVTPILKKEAKKGRFKPNAFGKIMFAAHDWFMIVLSILLGYLLGVGFVFFVKNDL